MNDYIGILAFCFAVGFFLLWFGIMIQIGRYKRWWLLNSTPIVPTSFAYVSVLVGILFLTVPGLAAYSPDPNVRGTAFITLICPTLIIIVILATWQPRWLKPKWLRWLETDHGAMLELLREEARKEEWSKWNQRVSTQEGLEEWVEEVRAKYKFNHPDQRFIGDPHSKGPKK